MAGDRAHDRGRARATRTTLSQRDVIDAALAFIDAHGLAALTMRNLATAMGAYPASLYWHAGNKSQLLAAACQRVLDEIDLPDTTELEWGEWIAVLAHRTRAAFRRHPNLAAYYGSHLQVDTTLFHGGREPQPPAAASFSYAESLLQVLGNAGFTGEDLAGTYNAVLSCIFGWITGEFATEPDTDMAPDWKPTFEESLRTLDPAHAPALSRNLDHLVNQAFGLRWDSGHSNPMDSGYEAAIRILIRGLRASLPVRDGG